MNSRIANDSAQREIRAVSIAGMIGQMQAVPFAIEVRNPETLERRIALGEAATKERARGCDAIELERRFGTLITHAWKLTDALVPNDWNRVE